MWYQSHKAEHEASTMASPDSSNQSDPVNKHTSQTNSTTNNESIPTNPYFLSASENPGSVLVTQPLLGMRNYHSWSRAMILALTAKKKIGFINGKISMPDLESPLYEDWQSWNTMVLSWLSNSMHVDVSSSIIYCETARDMWIELNNLFSQGNGPKIYNLQREISHITQNQMTVTEYFTKFKRLWDQLLNLEPLPECSCGAMKTLSATHDKAYVMRFLMGLNENFETIRTQILMCEPFPSISKVYALVLQEESHKHIGHGGSFAAKPDSVAMYVNSKGNNAGNANWSKGNNKKERPLCTHCNMLGHTIDKCYKLHGYPPGYKPKGKSNANQVSYDQGTLVEHPSFGTVQFPISKAQYEQLLAYFNTSSGSSNKHQAATVSSGDGVPSLMTAVAGVASFVSVPASASMAVTTSQPSASNSYLETMAGPCSLEHNWSG
ncbi:uncharacterized protein LOC126718978 [Quercus robur]|uniref:uncharacterized protein LOC126718978 n=1 Tax=Quercus robur TaxID=38942 RepID=UPI002161A134|nr:uncharacterized protein LOC126718978 [Quercus robur]